MRVIIREETIDLPITSVTIGHDKTDTTGTRLNMFFCPFCQAPLIQYHGHVYMITDGSIPDMFPLYRKCRGCKRTFAFNMIV